jgi:carbon-monoxide dehydrogenase medium subunit
VKPSRFEYHAPRTVDEAVGLLAEYGDDAKVLAGGQSLIPMLALRLAVFPHLVDIGRIGELRGVERHDGQLVVGAGTLDALIESDKSVAESVPLLSLATPLIGHFQIRNRGTIGGSLAHADPAAEYPAVAAALDAEMEVASTAGRRRVAAHDFFDGVWSTSLAPDEMLVAARFPIWEGRCGFAVREFARRHGDFAIAGAVVGVQLGSDNRVTRCAISLFGMGPTPVRARETEAAVVGAVVPGTALTGTTLASREPDELGRLAAAEAIEPPADLHGSGEYRRRVGAAMVAAAWTAAIEEANRV